MATNEVKRHFTFTLIDFYKEFKKHKLASGSRLKDVVPYKTHRLIIEAFLIAILKKIIYENFSFMMPYSLGLQCVKGRRTNLKDAKVDFKKTKALKKVVKHLNVHTFGFFYYIHWNKSYTNFKNNAYYAFRASGSEAAGRSGVGRKVLSKHIMQSTTTPDQMSYTRI